MAKYLIETDNGKYEIETDETQGSLAPLAEKAVSAVEPGPQVVPEKSFLQRLGVSTKEMFAPGVSGLKRLFSPQVGQFGPSRLLQQEGERVQKAVAGVSPTAAAILPPLTPRSAAEQIGGEGLMAGAVGPAMSVASKTIADPLSQLLTGIPGKEWFRLSKNIKSLRPSFLGGVPAKSAAGEAVGKAEEAAGLFKSVLPTGLGKEYVDKTIETITKYGPTGAERTFSAKELSSPKTVEKLIGELTPQEAFTLREAVKNTLDGWVEGKNSTEYRRYAILKDSIDGYLGKLSPILKEAQATFADAAQRSKFMSLFPRTKYGQPALGRIGFTGLATAGAAGVGDGDTSDRIKRGASVLALTSPITHSAARVAAAVAPKIGLQAILAGQRGADRVRVRNKQTGQTGTISKKFFDPNKYEAIQ